MTQTFMKDKADRIVKRNPDGASEYPIPLLQYLADQGYAPEFTYRRFNTITDTRYYCIYCSVKDKQGKNVTVKSEMKESSGLKEAMNRFNEELDKVLDPRKQKERSGTARVNVQRDSSSNHRNLRHE